MKKNEEILKQENVFPERQDGKGQTATEMKNKEHADTPKFTLNETKKDKTINRIAKKAKRKIKTIGLWICYILLGLFVLSGIACATFNFKYKIKKESYEDGYEVGYAKGNKRGFEKGYKKGYGNTMSYDEYEREKNARRLL